MNTDRTGQEEVARPLSAAAIPVRRTEGLLPYELGRGENARRTGNHRWTQMNTDRDPAGASGYAKVAAGD
jgi:hypothetical protein